MNLQEAHETLIHWTIPQEGFHAYLEILSGTQQEEFANEDNNEKFEIIQTTEGEQLALEDILADYINLRLSFLAIHNEDLTEPLKSLYQHEDGKFYPTLTAYLEYQSFIKHGVALTGLSVKNREVVIEESLQEGLADNLQWFYDKYSEEPIEVVTAETILTNQPQQILDFIEAIRKGEIYPHYRINNLSLQNDFDLSSAYRYLKKSPTNTMKGFISTVIAIATSEDKSVDKITIRDLVYADNLVFANITHLKKYFSFFRPSISVDDYIAEHGSSEGYANILNEELLQAHPKGVDEFILDSLTLPDNPETELDATMLQACQEEVLDLYKRGIDFQGENYPTLGAFKKAFTNMTVTSDVMNVVKEAFREDVLLLDLDETLKEQGLEIVEEDNTLTLIEEEQVIVGDPITIVETVEQEQGIETEDTEVEDTETKPQLDKELQEHIDLQYSQPISNDPFSAIAVKVKEEHEVFETYEETEELKETEELEELPKETSHTVEHVFIPKYIVHQEPTEPKDITNLDKEVNFIVQVNSLIDTLGINRDDVFNFVFEFEGVTFNGITVTSDVESYHIMVELYTNILINYLISIDKHPDYDLSTIKPSIIKTLNFAEFIEPAMKLSLIDTSLPFYIRYAVIKQNKKPILDMVSDIQEELNIVPLEEIQELSNVPEQLEEEQEQEQDDWVKVTF